jgi:hypothetical protein
MEYLATSRDEEKELSERVVVPLEALTKAYFGYTMSTDRQASRPTTIRITATAARDLQPVEDRRLLVSAAVFVGLLALTLALTAGLRWWLLRSARVLEGLEPEVLAQLDDTDAWPELPKLPDRQTAD